MAVLSPGTVMKSSGDHPPTENTVSSDTVLFTPPPPHVQRTMKPVKKLRSEQECSLDTPFGTQLIRSINSVPNSLGPKKTCGPNGSVRWTRRWLDTKGGGGWHKASVSDCLPSAAPIGLSPLLILTLRGSERVLVVSTEPPDDLSCLTTPGVGRPGDGAVARAVDQGHPDAHSESMRGFADSSTDLSALGCASAG